MKAHIKVLEVTKGLPKENLGYLSENESPNAEVLKTVPAYI